MPLPTPHYEKLSAALENDKLPSGDKPRLKSALARYQKWIAELTKVRGHSPQDLGKLISLLNEYKLSVDLELIYDSPDDFLYRQKGQLKLDNSIIEEFLPWLVSFALKLDSTAELQIGPSTCFSAIYFSSSLSSNPAGGGLNLRTKNQDFALGRRLYIKTSHDPAFNRSEHKETCLALVAAEIKTNLDKTMFQEACAPAHDVKAAVSGSKYYLFCEWLDMTPLSTAATDIDEVLILRGKRLPSNVRENFSSREGRRRGRREYMKFLKRYPFREDVLIRFISHLRKLFRPEEPVENKVITRGYF